MDPVTEAKDNEPGTDNIANMLRGEMGKALDVEQAVGDNFLQGKCFHESHLGRNSLGSWVTVFREETPPYSKCFGSELLTLLEAWA